jgi:hypothetical protein
MTAVVGVANHNGWANLVSVAMGDETPVVVDRRRVELMTPDLPNQPYQPEALDLPIGEAQALVDRVRTAAAACARDALATLKADLEPAHVLVEMALPASPFGERLPAAVVEALDYRPFVYVADTILYLEALEEAAPALGLVVSRHEKADAFDLAGRALGISGSEAEAWVKALGKPLGPPWAAEHQRAAAAAIAALPAWAAA